MEGVGPSPRLSFRTSEAEPNADPESRNQRERSGLGSFFCARGRAFSAHYVWIPDQRAADAALVRNDGRSVFFTPTDRSSRRDRAGTDPAVFRLPVGTSGLSGPGSHDVRPGRRWRVLVRLPVCHSGQVRLSRTLIRNPDMSVSGANPDLSFVQEATLSARIMSGFRISAQLTLHLSGMTDLSDFSPRLSGVRAGTGEVPTRRFFGCPSVRGGSPVPGLTMFARGDDGGCCCVSPSFRKDEALFLVIPAKAGIQ